MVSRSFRSICGKRFTAAIGGHLSMAVVGFKLRLIGAIAPLVCKYKIGQR
jgi:hypothetical protein